VLEKHMGITDLSRVFPGFASSGNPRATLF
jgi:hypothetical protein